MEDKAEVRPGDKVNTNYLFYFAEPFLSLLSFPVTMDTAVENVKIFVPFIRLAALTYRKQVIATNEFEKMRKDCTSIVYRFLLSMCGNEDLAEELTSETFIRRICILTSLGVNANRKLGCVKLRKTLYIRKQRG